MMETFVPTSLPAQLVALRIAITHVSIDLPKKYWSENPTRRIFGLLLLRGYSPKDRKIEKHEWVEIYDSDKELHDSKSGSGSKLPLSTPNVEVWIAEA
jgi:hypothetical protein